MNLRKFLMCYLGAVLFVGTAGASGYQVLSRQHAKLAAAAQPQGSGLPQAMVAAVAAGNDVPEAAPVPAVNSLPPLRRHVATSGTGHASPPHRLADRRPAAAAHPVHRPVVQAVSPPRPAAPMVAGQY